MRRSGLILSIVSLSAIIWISGCGGGGGIADATISGVWSDGQTRAADGTIEFDFTLNGVDLSGTARITTAATPPVIYTGTFTGTLTGKVVDLTINWTDPAGYGTTHFTGTIHGNNLSGSYAHTPPVGAPESGTVTLVKSNVTTPVTLTGDYTGSAHDNKNGRDSTLAESIIQTGNTFSGTLTVTDLNGVQTGPISGTIIGNRITQGSTSLSGISYSFDATVAGQVVSGKWFVTQDPSHNGTFTLTKTAQ